MIKEKNLPSRTLNTITEPIMQHDFQGEIDMERFVDIANIHY